MKPLLDGNEPPIHGVPWEQGSPRSASSNHQGKPMCKYSGHLHAVEKAENNHDDDDMVAWDDVKDRELDPLWVRDARQVEMQYVDRYKVYDYSTVAECRRVTGAEPVGTRWLDTNKGDSTNPCYRSRWVAQQYRRAWVESIFAATPNIETARLLIADAASRCRVIGSLRQKVRIMIIDIKRAYFNAPALQPIYVKLPPEDPRASDPNACGRLLKSLYGTRDAGANWHEAYTRFLVMFGQDWVHSRYYKPLSFHIE